MSKEKSKLEKPKYKKGDLLKAKSQGFYHNRRIKPGKIFVAHEDGELGLWMEFYKEEVKTPEIVNAVSTRERELAFIKRNVI